MIRISIISLILGIFIGHSSNAADAPSSKAMTLPIGMYSSDFVPRPLSFSSGECPDVHKIELKNNQILAELLILCEALQLGGIKPKFDFKNIHDYLRIINGSAEATTLMPGFVIWRKDINPALFYISDPVLKERDFVKGIYTVPSNKKLLGIKNYDELQNYMVATNQNWVHDNAEIVCITSKVTTAAFNPFSMARMVAAKRADFLLFPFFNAPDLTGSLTDIQLVPVPGVKVAFQESLHFIVSKKHPDGLTVYQALQKGLKELHANGMIRYTYEQLGFFNPKVKDWVELGCGYQTKNLQP